MSTNKKNRPVKELRAGDVTAAVWKNLVRRNGEPTEAYSIGIRRHYKDHKTEEWKTTRSFTPRSLANALIVLRRAQEYCLLTESRDANESSAT